MRRYLLRTTALMVVLALWMAVLPARGMAAEQKPLIVPVLFVQNARAVVFDKGTLTLKGISPTTIFFSNRPARIAGHFTTLEYLKLWDEGKDSFLQDPPNATVSLFEAGKEELVDVVVKISKPRLMGGDLTYDIAVIEGKVPKKGGACSVFIDIIGLPFTPLSFAGVARRTMHRTVMWDTAVTNTQAAAVAKLKELKSLQKQGLITEVQYQTESQKILNQLVELGASRT